AAVVAWSRKNASTTHLDLWASRYGGGAWNTSVVSSSADEAFGGRVALDSSGNGVVVFPRMEGDPSWTGRTLAARCTVAGGWAAAARIEPDTGDAANARVALNASGDGVAVWELVGGLGGAGSVRARRFSPTTGWGALSIVNAATNAANQPAVGIDG